MVWESTYPPTFPKRTPASPLKALYTGGHWGRSPAIVMSHNGPKNQITWGVQGAPLGASFPVPTRLASGKCGSICGGRGRPRMILTAVSPAFFALRKKVALRPNFLSICPRIKNESCRKGDSCAATHFCPEPQKNRSVPERCKRSPGGLAPGPLENRPIFFHMKVGGYGIF